MTLCDVWAISIILCGVRAMPITLCDVWAMPFYVNNSVWCVSDALLAQWLCVMCERCPFMSMTLCDVWAMPFQFNDSVWCVGDALSFQWLCVMCVRSHWLCAWCLWDCDNQNRVQRYALCYRRNSDSWYPLFLPFKCSSLIYIYCLEFVFGWAMPDLSTTFMLRHIIQSFCGSPLCCRASFLIGCAPVSCWWCDIS